MEWLSDHGIVRQRTEYTNGWIEVNTTIAEAEKLLDTEYYTFRHEENDLRRIACDGYSLPNDLRNHIDFVMPTIQLGIPRSGSRRETSRSPDDENVTHLDLDDPDRSSSGVADSAIDPSHWQGRTHEMTHVAEPGVLSLQNCTEPITIDCLRALYNFGPGKHNHTSNKLGIFNFQSRLLNNLLASLSKR